MGDFPMPERKFISDRMDLVMLNFSFVLHTIFWDFYEQHFFTLMCLDRMRLVRCLGFTLEKNTFELDSSEIETSCCSAMHMYFPILWLGIGLTLSLRGRLLRTA